MNEAWATAARAAGGSINRHQRRTRTVAHHGWSVRHVCWHCRQNVRRTETDHTRHQDHWTLAHPPLRREELGCVTRLIDAHRRPLLNYSPQFKFSLVDVIGARKPVEEIVRRFVRLLWCPKERFVYRTRESTSAGTGLGVTYVCGIATTSQLSRSSTQTGRAKMPNSRLES